MVKRKRTLIDYEMRMHKTQVLILKLGCILFGLKKEHEIILSKL